MSKVVPAAASVAATAPVVKKPKKVAGGSKARKFVGPSVTELITKAVSVSKERKGLSLAGLKKVLAAGGYDVEKNNSRIKLGLKSLVGKGTLVQTKGIGASGSFRLSKKSGEVKEEASKKRVVAAKPKKLMAKKPASAVKKPRKVVSAKSPKNVKKPVASAGKKVAKSPKRVTTVKPQKAAVVKSPAKVKTVKPKAAKAKKAASKKK